MVASPLFCPSFTLARPTSYVKMSSLKEKERAKEMQDKFQAILSALLKDEDNKYCVDCDAKGPRWASWNLGIFLCIRCAGIHRNLGVHISKVKSVNLDSWTAEQVAMMQEMGNSRARAVYEANIPDGFRRPQTDSALEAFVRSKYETKKYIAREWIPPQPKVPKEWLEDSRAEKKKARAKPASGVQLSSIPKVNEKPASSAAAASATKPASTAVKTEVKMPVKVESTNSSASNDLLGLDLGQPQQCVTQQAAAPTTSGGNELLDLFGGHQAAPTASAAPPQTSGAGDLMNGASAETNLFGDDTGGEDKKTSAKDSIMALFGGAGGPSVSQPQMYGVPGHGGQFYNYQQSATQAELSAGTSVTAGACVVNGSTDLMRMHGRPSQLVSQAPGVAQSIGNTSVSTNSSRMGMGQPDVRYMAPGVQAYDGQIPPHVYPGQAQYHMYQGAPTSFGVQHSEFPMTMSSQVTGTSFRKQSPAAKSNTDSSKTPVFQVPPSGSQSSSAQRVHQAQGYSQQGQPNMPWNYYQQARPGVYGNQGGVYMPPGQQMYPQGMVAQNQGMMGQPQGMAGQPQAMMGQPQAMMGQQPQAMMGQPQAMMGQQPQAMMGQPQAMMGQQPQAMMGQQPQAMMGQPQAMMGQGMGSQGMMPGQSGVMGQAAMNGSQPGMFNGQPAQMMAGNQGMYTPQQIQQLQFQQMQQQMTSMKLSGAQMGSMPQQAMPGAAAGNWGNTAASGHTLSNNLWQ